MAIVLDGTSGATLPVPLAVAQGGTGSTTLTLTSPVIAGTPTGVGVLTSSTAVASTSGTSIDFTGIPSWVKRVTVMFNGVSLSGTSDFLLRLGTGGTPATTGYISTSALAFSTITASTSSTAGFVMYDSAATYNWQGSYIFTNLSGNTWAGQGIMSTTSSTVITAMSSGGVTLGGVLNILRITTVNGTDTFDAGSINIMYE